MRAHHGTSKAALIGGRRRSRCTCLLPLATRRLAVAVWVAATLLIVPMAKPAYPISSTRPAGCTPARSIGSSSGANHAGEIGKAPMLGAGISTARALHGRQPTSPAGSARGIRRSTALHSHNAFLQAWYEAGAVGAALLLVLGLLSCGRWRPRRARAQPYLYATFAASTLIGGSSFSLWQPWFMAALGLAAVFAGLGRNILAAQRGDCAASDRIT